jgi:hypothetical protein
MLNLNKLCSSCGIKKLDKVHFEINPPTWLHLGWQMRNTYTTSTHLVSDVLLNNITTVLIKISMKVLWNLYVCFVLLSFCFVISSCLSEGSCLTYVICAWLRIVVSNTYCVVFLICFSSYCVSYVASFSGLSIFNCPLGIL